MQLRRLHFDRILSVSDDTRRMCSYIGLSLLDKCGGSSALNRDTPTSLSLMRLALINSVVKLGYSLSFGPSCGYGWGLCPWKLRLLEHE